MMGGDNQGKEYFESPDLSQDIDELKTQSN
jgi:hypothetical protein